MIKNIKEKLLTDWWPLIMLVLIVVVVIVVVVIGVSQSGLSGVEEDIASVWGGASDDSKLIFFGLLFVGVWTR